MNKMNSKTANAYLAKSGFPGFFVSKDDGVWYLLGDEGVVNHNVERCLHVVRASDLTPKILDEKVKELTVDTYTDLT